MVPAILKGLVVIAFATIIAIAAFLVHRRQTKLTTLLRHQHLAEPILGVVGTLYGVLLGFLVAGAMATYENAATKVDVEANNLCDIFRLSRGLPDDARLKIRASCRDYNKAVLNEEWDAMEAKALSPNAYRAYQELWDEVLSLKPQTSWETNTHQAILAAMQGLGENRRSRIALCMHAQPVELWLVVIAGGAIVIGLTFGLVGKSLVYQSVLIGLVATSVCLNIFLLATYSFPFRGDLKVRPEGFALNEQFFLDNDSPITGLMETDISKRLSEKARSAF